VHAAPQTFGKMKSKDFAYVATFFALMAVAFTFVWILANG